METTWEHWVLQSLFVPSFLFVCGAASRLLLSWHTTDNAKGVAGKRSRGNTTASIELHGVLCGKITTSTNMCKGLKICMPFVPETPDVDVQVNNETGQLRVNWAGSVMRVRDTGCHARGSQFTVVIQSTHSNASEAAELVLNTITSNNAVTVNDQPSSDISASVKADNGFFESEWTQKQLRLCRTEHLDAAQLVEPRSKSLWNNGIRFTVADVPVPVEWCTVMHHIIHVRQKDGGAWGGADDGVCGPGWRCRALLDDGKHFGKHLV